MKRFPLGISSIFDAHVVKNDFYGCPAKGVFPYAGAGIAQKDFLFQNLLTNRL